MSEAAVHSQIIETGEKILADLATKQSLEAAELGSFPDGLWQALESSGFTEIGSADTGTRLSDAFAFTELCGRFAAPIPIAETLLVNRWAGAEPGVHSIGLIRDNSVHQVPWGRTAKRVIGIEASGNRAVLIHTPTVVEEHSNLAGEPRDRVSLPEQPERLELPEPAFATLALARAAASAGALNAIVALGVRYATERAQFGRPLAGFQAIQHTLAVAAAETLAATTAVRAAAQQSDPARFDAEVAAARSRVGQAIRTVSDAVHQVHGALGFTHEHILHHFTRRTWAWRDEYGNELS
ncbi:MAG: acyl-CoA dehydrogenase family protein [Pseudomonadota bacterium]